jgi:hypothetical protein
VHGGTSLRRAAALAAALSLGACAAQRPGPAAIPQESRSAAAAALRAGELPPFFDDLQARTFRFFWERGNPANGLVPDRYPSDSPSSIAAVGFALTAYPIGIERGYITRAEGLARTLATLRFFARAPQGEAAEGTTGYRGFFYHFLDRHNAAARRRAVRAVLF